MLSVKILMIFKMHKLFLSLQDMRMYYCIMVFALEGINNECIINVNDK